MKKYESPIAERVEFEAVDVVALSLVPAFLITWGKNLKSLSIDGEDVDAEDTSLLNPESDTPDFYI
ncbi:MAG: hypothetical protein IJC81_05385 [Clostridia bacterium]|nr:hypothetical protein [Clostridia bacterium]